MAFRRLHSRAPIRPRAGLGAPAPGPPPTFNGDVANLYEDVGDGPTEVNKAGFSPEGGKSSREWQIAPASVADLISAYPAILGQCNYTASGTGRLNRTLPLADPLYAWMYASSVPTVEGYGTAAYTAADPTLEAAGFPAGALWDQYRLTVESLPRPFPVLPDNLINTFTGTWYPETGGGTTSASYAVAQEMYRYCTWQLDVQNDYVTQQKGRMKFFSSSNPPNGKSYQGMPRVLLPNQLYTVVWYYVPLRLIVSPNSYLYRWRGRINQNALYGPDGFAFNPGELLYLTFSFKPFTPPIQNLVALSGGGGSIVSTEKFAHVTMQFLYTTRKTVAPPAPLPTNKNYVVGGHNLLPFSDGSFYYAATPDGNYPTWLSAPLETLWTDPDSPGGAP